VINLFRENKKENIENLNSEKDYQLNIYNNFLITNSTITQMLDNFISRRKTIPKSKTYIFIHLNLKTFLKIKFN